MNNSSWFSSRWPQPLEFSSIYPLRYFFAFVLLPKGSEWAFSFSFFFSFHCFCLFILVLFLPFFLFLSCLFFSLCEDLWRQCVFQLIYSFSASAETEKKQNLQILFSSKSLRTFSSICLHPFTLLSSILFWRKGTESEKQEMIRKYLCQSRESKKESIWENVISPVLSQTSSGAHRKKYSEFLSVQCQRRSDRIVP